MPWACQQQILISCCVPSLFLYCFFSLQTENNSSKNLICSIAAHVPNRFVVFVVNVVLVEVLGEGGVLKRFVDGDIYL